MLKVAVINILKNLQTRGKSIREISRDTGHHRETIKKYLEGAESKYTRGKGYASDITDFAKPIVTDWHTEDLKINKKQRRAAQKMYNDLVSKYDFNGSYSTICMILQELKKQNREVFVPRANDPGEYIEFDFGYIKAWHKGELKELAMHCFQLICSNDIFVYISERETQEEIFYAHKLAFEYYEGVPIKVRYDNLKQAVKKILHGKAKEESSAFKNFRDQYGFIAEFCERGKGWQKGDVEGLVGYARRNYCSPIPEINDLNKFNKELAEWCKSLRNIRKVYGTDKLVGEMYLLEKEQLSPLPINNVEVGIHTVATANHYSLVPVDTAFYSVPSNYAYRIVNVLLTAREVIISDKAGELARHNRTFIKGKQVFDPTHYISVFLDKPYAAINTKPIKQLPECFSAFFKKAYSKGYGTVRNCIKVLELLKTYSLEQVKTAIELSMTYQTYNKEGVENLLMQLTTSQPIIEKLEIPKDSKLNKISIPSINLSIYNQLISKRRTN